MEDAKMTSSCSRNTLRHDHDHDHHQLRSGGGGGGGGDGARDNGKKRPPTMAAAAAMAMPKMMKRATVVYYLTRNGQLEHPHFMEVPHLPSLPLRLRDVMDRLTSLRGKGMPSMYSWSCKRSYKNGYVWNDLSENDVILPADGAEYVLKGSEIVDSCSERLQQLNISNRLINNPEADQVSKKSAGAPGGHIEVIGYSCQDMEHEYEGQEEYEDEEKTSYTSSTTPHSRCSRGVSTDELDEPEPEHGPETQKKLCREPPSLSPPYSTTSSTLISDQKPVPRSADSSRRFSDNDWIDRQAVPRFALGRNSVLLQLISCGGMAKTVPKSDGNNDNSSDLHKGALCKGAAKAVPMEDEAAMIVYMSENPRFGNLQSQEKEYFSGSIIEAVRDDHDRAATEPVLKKSNSYNEERERSSLVETEEAVIEGKREKSTAKGKCIPRMISTSKITKKR